MYKKLLAVALMGTLLSGCASRPESISASYVSHEKYMHLDCSQLLTTISDARAKLEEFSDKQDTKANADAGTVFLALVPISALTGDYEADVAKWKGEIEAIETVQIKKECKALDI